MADDQNSAEKGRREARTGADFSGNSPLPAGEVDPRPLAESLKAALEADAGHQPGLFDEEEPELPETLAIGATRSRLDSPRGRGRPLGAGNKRSELLREQLLKLGFQHPLVVLATIASATPDEVAAEMVGGEKALAALPAKVRAAVGIAAVKAISDAADRLTPYFESKRPTDINVKSDKRALFLVGQINTTAPGSSAFSIGGGNGNPFSFQGDSEIVDVREEDASSHDES